MKTQKNSLRYWNLKLTWLNGWFSNEQVKHVFIRPYRMAMPFTGVMLLTVFLFRKRNDYLSRGAK